MFYELLTPFAADFGPFNLFRYLTFRTGGAVLTALAIALFLGPRVIAWLKSKQGAGQPIREDGPESHLVTKKGTPTMGGVLILIAAVGATILWVDPSNGFVWACLGVMVGFGAIGFVDDYLKLTKRNTKGLPGRAKLLVQFTMAFVATMAMIYMTASPLDTSVTIPFFKDVLIDLGLLYIPFAMIVMVGASNAVNLTDGLDGLAIVPTIIACGVFGLIASLVGNAVFAGYLQIAFVPDVGELAILCGAIIGAGLGFLWYNAPPAMVFMGDTGSLALGGAIGAIAVATKHELVLAIVGGLFVLEAVSVIVQVASFKLTGKRVFRMAPLHHHFEKKGWPEPTIVIRFWIIAGVLALIGLSTLKLR